MRKPRYDWVLLDADRTLFDFERSQLVTLRRTLEQFGIPADEETIALYLKINQACWDAFERGELDLDTLERERFVRLLAALDIRDQDPSEMNRFYIHHFAQVPYLMNGAEELCKLLKPHCRLIIVTNGLTVSQTGRLANSSLKDDIDAMYISQQMGVRKPEPEFFRQVFAQEGMGEAELRRAVIVGDSLQTDIQGGINAGIDTIWLNQTGKTCPNDMKITHIVENLKEVGEIVLGF